jgi:anti-sigma factor RsiW
MTCAETRRQLPEPEPALQAAVSEHLSDCVACRTESDSLKEVDRRLQRLCEARRTAAAPLKTRLEQVLHVRLGLGAPATRTRGRAWPLVLGLLLVLGAVGAWFLGRHH